MENVKVDTSEVATKLPRGSDLVLEVEERNWSDQNRSGTGIPETKKLRRRRRAVVARLTTTTRIGTLMERHPHTRP